MRILVLILLACLTIFESCRSGASELQKTGFIKFTEAHGVGGFWKSKVQWKAHWVKTWQQKKIYVPVWKKIWAPVDIKEWVPLPDHHKHEAI